MLHRKSFALGAMAALLVSIPACASDIVYPGGGTLAQIVDGGGTYTLITLVNLDTVAVPYSLYFYDDNGNPLTLTTTAGTGAVLTGTLSIGGSTIIQTNGGGGTVLQGYGVLVATSPSCFGFGSGGFCDVAGSAVFSIPLASGVVAQASCPLDTGIDYILELPFDETGDATSAQTGLALANSPLDAPYEPLKTTETAYVNVAFFDQNGNAIPTPPGQVDTTILPPGGHTAFMLDQTYPQIKGQRGTAVFTTLDANGYNYIVKVLGLRATPTTFTSITPIVPCFFSTSVGCQN
jgi:hypothetical protein